MSRVITPSEAIGIFERAFRIGYPDEIERTLRNISNVYVAIIEKKEEVEQQINKGYKLQYVSVPYGVFISKAKEYIDAESIFKLTENPIIAEDEPLLKIYPVYSLDEILPGNSYILTNRVASYSNEEGLNFEGTGGVVGFEEIPLEEKREKFLEGKFQTWQEHSLGVYKNAKRILEFFYRPFLERWAQKVIGGNLVEDPQFVDKLVFSIEISALFHDIGKLNQKWQSIMWKNEEIIRGMEIENKGFIARTSPIQNEGIKKKLRRPPAHAIFAYPFLKIFLRKLLGDYRFLDSIALATSRHHSLEFMGGIKKGDFKITNEAKNEILSAVVRALNIIEKSELDRLNTLIEKAIEAVKQGTEMDEPPSPTDDFYLIYCMTNRVVKIADWEDAGDVKIELTGGRKDVA